jgi:hypothetical protein
MNNKLKISSFFIMFVCSVAQAKQYGVMGDCQFPNVHSDTGGEFKLYVTADLAKNRKSILPSGFLANTTTKKYKSIPLKVIFSFTGPQKVYVGYVLPGEFWEELAQSNPPWIAYSTTERSVDTNVAITKSYDKIVQQMTTFNINPKNTDISGDGSQANPYTLKSIGDSDDWMIIRDNSDVWHLKGTVYDISNLQDIKKIDLNGDGRCQLSTIPISSTTPDKLLRSLYIEDSKQ